MKTSSRHVRELLNGPFHGPTDEQLPWSNLPDFLRTADDVYWISGKADSGKSTFMKHIFDSNRTRECLRSWARGTLLIVAAFFFWNSGTREQKSQLVGDQEGLSRLFKEVIHSRNVKACLSSRPWVIFEQFFGKCPSLRLENLTYRDTKNYTGDKFRCNDAFQRLVEENPETARSWVHEIVEKQMACSCGSDLSSSLY